MLNDKIAALLNDQVNKELYSAYLYLDFANYYADEGLDGFAHWYEVQAQEERDHALIFRNYLHENGEKVKLLAIDQPDKTFSSYLEPLEAGLEHEKYVTSLINDIYAVATAERDYASQNMLQWFIKEQVEEEETAREYIDALEKIGDNGYGLYMFDKELAARVYSTPAPLAAKG